MASRHHKRIQEATKASMRIGIEPIRMPWSSCDGCHITGHQHVAHLLPHCTPPNSSRTLGSRTGSIATPIATGTPAACPTWPPAC